MITDWVQFRPTASYVSCYFGLLKSLGIRSTSNVYTGDGVYRRVGDRIEIRVLSTTYPSINMVVPKEYRASVKSGTLTYDPMVGIASAIVYIAGW